jgi:hypothetical protein
VHLQLQGHFADFVREDLAEMAFAPRSGKCAVLVVEEFRFDQAGGMPAQSRQRWGNCYHAYPAHATFDGYKESGIGRETHKVMLDHYQQTKNLLVSYSPKVLGFF